MARTRVVRGADFKARVALAAAEGGQDAERIGKQVSGASYPDQRVEEAAAGAGCGAVPGRSQSEAETGRLGSGRTGAVRADRSAENGAGLVEKKSWPARLN